MLILTLAWKHKLTNSALTDLLKVICLHLPREQIPGPYKSVYRLLKTMPKLQDSTGTHKVIHHLCGKCGADLLYNYDACDCIVENGGLPVVSSQTSHMFLELPIDLQLQALFQSK